MALRPSYTACQLQNPNERFLLDETAPSSEKFLENRRAKAQSFEKFNSVKQALAHDLELDFNDIIKNTDKSIIFAHEFDIAWVLYFEQFIAVSQKLLNCFIFQNW